MTISRVTRVSNPRKRRTSSKRRSRKANPRRLSLKQKLHFGTPRQRNAAKAALRRKRSAPKRKAAVKRVTRKRTARASNPRRRRRVAKANPVKRRRRRRASNPAHMVTLGLLNPSTGKRKRRKTSKMAKTRKRRSTRRRASANPRRRRRNSVRVIVRRSRHRATANPRRRRRATASNPRRRARHHARGRRRSSRNPVIFGTSVSVLSAAKIVAAGLAGVWATQLIVGMLPTNMLPSTPVTGALMSAGVAIALGTVASMVLKSDPMVGYAIGFGGLMSAGSTLANSIGLSQFGLRGLGDLVPGRFPIPQNPIMAGNQVMLPAPSMPAPAGAGAGVGAIYNPFGRAM